MNRGKGRAIQRRTSRAIESHLQTVGWISRQKISRLPAGGEAFFLTSLFFELPISRDIFSKVAQFGEMSNSVGSITAGNCTFNGVLMPFPAHKRRSAQQKPQQNPHRDC